MKTYSLLCVVAVAISSVVGCAAPQGDQNDPAAESQSDLTGDGTYDPTVTSPVAWGCNFGDGSSAVFVQERVHSAYGTLSTYAAAQDPQAGFATLSTGGDQDAVTTTRVKFKQVDAEATFTATDAADKPVVMTVTVGEHVRMGSRVYPMAARVPESKAVAGCWGIR